MKEFYQTKSCACGKLSQSKYDLCAKQANMMHTIYYCQYIRPRRGWGWGDCLSVRPGEMDMSINATVLNNVHAKPINFINLYLDRSVIVISLLLGEF